MVDCRTLDGKVLTVKDKYSILCIFISVFVNFCRSSLRVQASQFLHQVAQFQTVAAVGLNHYHIINATQGNNAMYESCIAPGALAPPPVSVTPQSPQLSRGHPTTSNKTSCFTRFTTVTIRGGIKKTIFFLLLEKL